MTRTFRLAVVVALAASPTAMSAERPSAAQVAQAVEESQARYIAVHTPTVETLEKELSELEQEHAEAVRQKDKTRIRELLRATSELKKRIARLRRGHTETVEPQLMPIDWGQLTVGAVGRIGAPTPKGQTKQTIKVHQIVGDGRFLGQMESSAVVPIVRNGRIVGSRPEPRNGPWVLFSGFKPSGELIEGRHVEIVAHAVVTGQYSFQTVSGAMKTVPVLEPFDPAKPFK